jgi:hypothetical protein
MERRTRQSSLLRSLYLFRTTSFASLATSRVAPSAAMFKLTALSVLGLLASAFASPAPAGLVRSPAIKRSVPSNPHFVVYSDDFVSVGFITFLLTGVCQTDGSLILLQGALPPVADVEVNCFFLLLYVKQLADGID